MRPVEYFRRRAVNRYDAREPFAHADPRKLVADMSAPMPERIKALAELFRQHDGQ